MSPEFVKVARAVDIPENKSRRVVVDDEEIALWHVGGKFYAIANVCPHQHFPVLYQGTLEGITVTCPMHGWTYSLETGAATTGNGRVRTYRTKVEGDDVWVERPGERW